MVRAIDSRVYVNQDPYLCVGYIVGSLEFFLRKISSY